MCSKGFSKLSGPYKWKETYDMFPSGVDVCHVCHLHLEMIFMFFPKRLDVSDIDQRALGMSMRVERSSLQQVYLLFNESICSFYSGVRQKPKPFHLDLPCILRLLNFLSIKVQDRFEVLKKRKSAGSFSERGMEINAYGCIVLVVNNFVCLNDCFHLKLKFEALC